MSLCRVIFGTPIPAASLSPDSARQLGEPKGSEGAMHSDVNDTSVHLAEQNRNLARPSSACQKNGIFSRAPFFGWPVLALLCLLQAAYHGIGFFSSCRTGRLYSRLKRPAGTGGLLFPLPQRLGDLIQSVGERNTFYRTALAAELAHDRLHSIRKVN